MAMDGNHQALRGALRDNNARACISALCQQVHEGKLAARQLAEWVVPLGVNEAEFRLLWQLFAAAETALASAAKIGRGAGGDAPLEPAILDQATMAERLAASPAHVSATVERLSGAGLISAIAAAADRRRQCWQLTFAGRELVLAVLASVAQATASKATRSAGRDAA
jgi:DNA-binding MarR family transcriptional regulator